MNCQNHPEMPAAAYCRACGKPVCNECRRDAFGTVYCSEHLAAPAAAPPPPAAAPYGAPAPPPPYQQASTHASVSPGLALGLGFIPGVGAIYNGQYAKGLVHAIVFGILCSVTSSVGSGLEPVFGLVLTAWIFYMAFEAYHTAQRRSRGELVDEYSSLIDLRSQGQFPAAGVGLIVVGILMLLHTLDLFDFHYVVRFWPVLLIMAGAYMLYVRFAGGNTNEGGRS